MDRATSVATTAPARATPEETLPAAIRTVWRVLIERFWVFTGVSIVLFVAAAVFIMMITPKYEAAAQLKVDPMATAIAGVDTTTRGMQPDRSSIESEVNVIKSRDLAKIVARKMNLFNDPDLDPNVGAPMSGPDAPSMDQRLDGIAGALLDSLYVVLNDNTYVISVTGYSTDPEKAARIANAFAEAYITSNVGTRTGTAAQQAGWLQQRKLELAKEVQAADAQVAIYKANAGIVQGGANGTITDQQVGPIAAQLASAESEAAEARAKVASARAQIAAGNLDAVANVLGSPVVTNLRTQRAEVLRNRDDITARYGPKHPEAVRVSQQLQSLDDQIAQEARRVTASLASQAAASDARARSLQGSLSSLRNQQAGNTRAAVTADTLERQAAAKRLAYDQIAKAEQDSQQASHNSLANVRIIESARTPDRPTSPNRPLYLGAAFLLSVLAGAAFITVQELLTRGVRTLKDVEVRLGVPLVAAVPKLANSVTKSSQPADYLVDKPMTFYAESYRTIRSALLLANGDRLPDVITITSALPGEGKSSTALSLARAMALAGDKVVLLDCDFRRVGIHAQTGYRSDVTLFDILHTGADPKAAIKPDRVEGVDIIGNNEPVFTPVDLFNGKPMSELLDWLRPRYDAILIDTPPLLGVADARTLAAQADAVLMIVGWDRTPIDAVDKALTILQQDHVRLIGAVLTAVDPNAELMGSNYYSKKYAAYYRD